MGFGVAQLYQRTLTRSPFNGSRLGLISNYESYHAPLA